MTRKPADTSAIVDPVEAAREEVVRLRDLELDTARQRLAKARELALLAPQEKSAFLQQHAALTGEIAYLEATTSSTRRLRGEAIAAVREARAQAEDEIAAKQEADADTNKSEVERALKQLEAVAGCTYGPTQPRFDGPVTQGVGGSPRVVFVQTPKFEVLRNEAASHRRAAAELRRQTTVTSGTVEAVGVDALIDAVLADPMRIGPAIDELMDWASDAIAREQRRRARYGSTEDQYVAADAPFALRVTWRAGVIVPAESAVDTQRALAQVEPYFTTPQRRVAPSVTVIDVDPEDLDAHGAPVAAQSTPYEKGL